MWVGVVHNVPHELRWLVDVWGVRMCTCSVFSLGSIRLRAVFCIHFLEDEIACKQILNCIMLKLLPMYQSRMDGNTYLQNKQHC